MTENRNPNQRYATSTQRGPIGAGTDTASGTGPLQRSARLSLGCEVESVNAELERLRQAVEDAIARLRESRKAMRAIVFKRMSEEAISQLEEITTTTPEARAELDRVIEQERAGTLPGAEEGIDPLWSELGRQWIPLDLSIRHDRNVAAFLEALEDFEVLRQDLRRDCGPIIPPSKDSLSEAWDWAQELTAERGIAGGSGDSANVKYDLRSKVVELTSRAAWEAFAMFADAYRKWREDRRSEEKTETLAEARALLEVNLTELNRLDVEEVARIGEAMVALIENKGG